MTVLTGLVERRPDDPAIKAALGRALTRFASVKPEVGAEKTVCHALELLKEANKALPNDAEFLTDLARASNNLVAAFPVERQSGSEAIALFDEARKSAKKSLALNPTSSVTHNIHDRAVENLCLAGAGRIDEAVRMLEEAVANGKVFTRRNPAVLWGYRSLTSVQTELARTFQRLAKYDQAIEAWEDVARVNEGLTQRDPRNPDYPYERINALVSVHDIEKSRSHRAQAASALECADGHPYPDPPDECRVTQSAHVLVLYTAANWKRTRSILKRPFGSSSRGCPSTRRSIMVPVGEAAGAEVLKQYIECASSPPMPVSPSSRICPRRSGSSSDGSIGQAVSDPSAKAGSPCLAAWRNITRLWDKSTRPLQATRKSAMSSPGLDVRRIQPTLDEPS